MAVRRLIDVHSHLFNLYYVPVEEVIDSKGLPRAVAIALGALLRRAVVGAYPRRDKSMRLFAASDPTPNLMADVLMESALAGLRSHDPNVVREVEGHLRTIQKFYGSKRSSDKRMAAFQDALDELELFETPFRVDFLAAKALDDSARAAFFGPLVSAVKAVKQYLGYFGKMLNSENMLFKTLTDKNYGSNDPALIIHHMMDLEPAYWKFGSGSCIAPTYDFHRKQVSQAGKFVQKANGRLLGFVAFDPRREKGFEQCKAALKQGNVGIKIYPPLGYSPNDPEYGSRLDKMYAYCEKHAIPVMAHCTPVGFQREEGSGVLSDPAAWRHVMERFPAMRLCLGHAGGGVTKIGRRKVRGWFHNDMFGEESYPRTVVELCRDFENVYADFSYLHTIMDKDERPKIMGNMEKAVQDYACGSKIMYGTDWHMAKLINQVQKYCKAYEKMFAESDVLGPYSDAFFFSNALRFLNLDGYLSRQTSSSVHSKSALRYLERVSGMASPLP